MLARVGMIGLGVMGSAMAANLLKAGFRVVGYDPLKRCCDSLRRMGGKAADSPEAIDCAVVITSLPSSGALLQISKSLKTPRIVIETSTLPIPVKEKARRILARKGITLLDCPLSGTGAQARAGDLAVYASGPLPSYKKALPVLRGFSRAQFHLGAFGNGSRMKFVANLLVAIHNVSAAEAVVLARRSGLNAATAVKVLGDGAGSSRMLQVRGPMMARRRYRPATMSMRLWQKDMTIIGDFVRRLKSPAPLFKATGQIYKAALRQGLAQADTAAVCAVLEKFKRR